MRKQTLLVVDDERSAREGLVRLFKRDYHVVAAESGATALALLDSHEVDLMLCDVRMPGMDGLTLMERAHEQQPELLVVVMTAYGDVELAVEAMQRGARDFMTKPLQLEKLEVGVRGLLKARDLERENASLRAQLDVRYGMENMIGQSAPMQEFVKLFGRWLSHARRC